MQFGTDGVRGVANQELTPELVVALGRAAARVLGRGTGGPSAPGFLVGRDTRVSGPLLQSALAAGLASEGAAVVDLGVLPTPGVAFASARLGLPAAVISASHNPFPDNGIKLFAAGGRKLADDVEEVLEAELARILSGGGTERAPTGAGVGRLQADHGALDAYVGHLVDLLEGRPLEGLRVVLDCANGAASEAGPRAVAALGADVEVIGARPDGTNINAGCGSTHPEGLQRAVVEAGADAGLAFDGDADRVLAVDHRGELVDGDQMLALCAIDLHERGQLRGETVVVTVMTNLGFRQAMESKGIAVHETAVGDRYVLEALEAGGWSLGGEQSGHVIFRDMATTGDGILTGVQLLHLVRRAGRPLGELAGAAMTRLPQVLRNVRVATRRPEVATLVRSAVEAVEAEMRGQGRVLVRPSGTEPLVRVMVEATEEDVAHAMAHRLAAEVERACGAA
ncbi:MAG: phosphoglucosamine mutase [Actinomycetota bacterium]|nr:phosphoglucosamine mutase [Actinomycetota bacterium]